MSEAWKIFVKAVYENQELFDDPEFFNLILSTLRGGASDDAQRKEGCDLCPEAGA